MSRNTVIKRNKKTIILSVLFAAIGIALVIAALFLFRGSKYATKNYVWAALGEYSSQLSDDEIEDLNERVTKIINTSFSGSETGELTDEQYSQLLADLYKELSETVVDSAQGDLRSLCAELIKEYAADEFGTDSDLYKEYADKYDELLAQYNELQSYLNENKIYSQKEIEQIINAYGMSEDDIRALIEAVDNGNDTALQNATSRYEMNLEQLKSLLERYRSLLNQQDTTETNARTAADDKLTTDLATEAKNRTDADSAEKSAREAALDAEEKARIAADAAEEAARVAALDDEAATREAADKAEAAAREAADAQEKADRLQAIADEATAREAADKAEATARNNADNAETKDRIEHQTVYSWSTTTDGDTKLTITPNNNEYSGHSAQTYEAY